MSDMTMTPTVEEHDEPGVERVVRQANLYHIVGKLPNDEDDGGLMIRVRGASLPAEMRNLPVGTVIMVMIESLIPPRIEPLSDDLRRRAEQDWGTPAEEGSGG